MPSGIQVVKTENGYEVRGGTTFLSKHPTEESATKERDRLIRRGQWRRFILIFVTAAYLLGSAVYLSWIKTALRAISWLWALVLGAIDWIKSLTALDWILIVLVYIAITLRSILRTLRQRRMGGDTEAVKDEELDE